MTINNENQGYPVNLLKALFINEPIPDHTASYFDGALQQVLSDLPERNKDAVIYRYRDGMTYRQVGEVLGVSAERVRQITVRGLRMLRNPSRRDLLEGKSVNDYENGDLQTSSMHLSVRAFNCLARKMIFTANGILSTPPEELRKIRNLGAKTYNEIMSRLEELGYDVSAYRTRQR